MASQDPMVVLYELVGSEGVPFSPFCWHTRFTLNYKGIPYKIIKLPFPDIKPTCERLFGADFASRGIDDSVPIIEILPSSTLDTKPQLVNDSIPIAKLLNEVFTPEHGFKHLKGVEDTENAEEYRKEVLKVLRAIVRWVCTDIYGNLLKGDGRSQEFFKRTREAAFGCSLAETTEKFGGEEKLLGIIREGYVGLRKRMAKDDGSGEPSYLDFYDAGFCIWVRAASPEKFEKMSQVYGDDTFTKLMKKTEKYYY